MKENDCFKQEVAKFINKEVMGSEFVDKDLDKYIYANLSQPPIKILNKNGSNDEMDFTVEWPNCHRAVCYGDSIYTLHGHIYCDTKGCREKLAAVLGRHEDE